MKKVLGFVFAWFVGVLIFCWIVAEKADPVLLDEHGRPVKASQARK
jgi:hypothetical protein